MWTPEHERRHEQVRLLKERISDQYVGRNGVVGIGVGFKVVGGQETDELVIRFHVSRKGKVAKEAAVPSEIEGVKTDVVETEVELHAFEPLKPLPLEEEFGPADTRIYPNLEGGISIGITRKIKDAQGLINGAGTLGLIVTDLLTGGPMILSNSHILCPSKSAMAGDQISQPDPTDTSPLTQAIAARRAADPTNMNNYRCSVCAVLALRDRWVFGNEIVDGVEYGMDAALGFIPADKGSLRGVVRASVRDVGKVVYSDKVELRPGMKVRKRGRTTKLTYGKIFETNTDMKDATGKVTLKNQFLIAPGVDPERAVPFSTFGTSGDSGSVVLTVDSPPAVVGLYWGGTPEGMGIASPIGPILKELQIQILG